MNLQTSQKPKDVCELPINFFVQHVEEEETGLVPESSGTKFPAAFNVMFVNMSVTRFSDSTYFIWFPVIIELILIYTCADNIYMCRYEGMHWSAMPKWR
jgi:hypothetical protein